MTITIRTEVDHEVKFLMVSAKVRYWEDSTVNGIEDVEGKLIPCREGDNWNPIIELETGKIVDWPIGTSAEIHYKVCDGGVYSLVGNGDVVCETDGYVPDMLSPKDSGHGDYIIMDIDENGIIQDWEADLSYFTTED